MVFRMIAEEETQAAIRDNRVMRRQMICLLGSALLASLFPLAAWGQDSGDRRDRGKREYSREQIQGHLNRLDDNDNQVLELNEMSDRTKGWLRGLGLDTSRPVKVSSVMRKVDSDKATKAKIEKRKQMDANRLVPKFGVEDSSEAGAALVPDFSDAAPISPGSLEEKYGKKIMSQVDSVLQRYDTNKSGTLNSQEIAAARWGRPTPQDSDTNKDGRLTRSELAERYVARAASSRKSSSDSSKKEDLKEKSRTSSSRSSSRESSSRSKSRSGGSDLQSRMDKYQSKVDEKYDKSASEEKSSSKDSSYNSGNDRYKRYADALLKQYDKDKDNRLSKSEVKAMRRPPSEADSNGDGMISRDELIDSIANPKSSSRSSSSEEKSTRSSSRSRFSSRSREGSDSDDSKSSSRSSSSRVSFSGNDTNKDGQLQMHEFAREWDSDTLEDFKKKDKNGDGIITRAEWTGR